MKKDFTEYKEVLKKGLAQRKNIENAIKKVVEKGVDNVFLVGCGGSLAVMSPIKYILEINSKLPVYEYNASEFINIKPKAFGSKSLVILSSYTGTTKETVAAAQLAKEVGATAIGFAGKAESPLGTAVDYIFANDASMGVTDSKLIMLYQIVFNLIKHTDKYNRYEEMMEALATLPESLVAIKKLAEEKAEKFANKYKDSKYIMVIGAGAGWGEAYSYATCILEEMQWILAQPVHAGEFFHGAFEIIVDDTDILVFQGEDLTRSLLDRVIEFAPKYTKRMELIDTKDYPLPGIAEDLRGYFTPFILSTVMDRYSDNLSSVRNHPLSTRRYMTKVDY